MLAQQILDDVRRELLEYSAPSFWSDAELIRHLNRGQMDFVNRTRMLEDFAQIQLQQGRIDYVLPSNYLSVRLFVHNVPDSNGTANWMRIYPSNLEKIVQENPQFLDVSTTSQDRPSKYYIWNNTLYITPAPDAQSATTAYLFYKAKPMPIVTPSVDNISIDESLADGLTAFVLWKAWTKEGEADKAAENKQTYLEYVGEGRRWLKKKSGDQRFRLDIDSPISFTGDRPGFSPFR
jgi:hypothetical protein